VPVKPGFLKRFIFPSYKIKKHNKILILILIYIVIERFALPLG